MRRSSQRFARLGLMALVLCGVVARAQAEDWPRWRGPRGDGSWHGPKLPDHWPQSGLLIRWRQPIGGGYAGVVVAGGRVYTMDRQPAETDAEGEAERVLCFDAASGKSLWAHSYPVHYGNLDYGSGPRAAPTVFAGRVYTLGALGNLYCLDAVTGRVFWSQVLIGGAPGEKSADGKPLLPEWGLAASPVIFANLVIVHPGVQRGGCLMAFDCTSGREVWRAGDDPAGYATPIVIDHAGEKALIAWTPLHVLSLAPSTGEIQWSIDYPVTYGVSIATPIFHEGWVLVSGYWEGSKAIRLGRTSLEAKLAWEDDRELRGLMSQPLVRDGLAYLLDKQHGLVCFELASGKVLWNDGHRMTPRGRNPQATLVWLGDGDRAIILNSEGELILARLARDGYDEQSRTKLIGPTWAHPAYAGDCVFARDDMELVCAPLTTEK